MDVEAALAKAAAVGPGADGEQLAEVFQGLRRAAQAPHAAEALQRWQDKISVLRFLLAVYERKRLYRRQVASLCSLLGRHGWAAALTSDADLRQRWPAEMHMEVANCGGYASADPPVAASTGEKLPAQAPAAPDASSDAEDEGESSPVSVAPQRSMADTLAMLEDGLKRLAAAKYSFTVLTGTGLDEDDIFAAFETFRRAVCRITQDSRIDKSALDKIEHKDRILRFLLDVHARKRPHRKRTEALLSLLLELDSWQKAFADDQDLEEAIAQFRRAEEGNQAQELTAEEEEEAQEDLRSLSTLWRDDVEEKLAAAAARGSIGVLLVRVVAAYNLINADWFSLSDPYVKVKVGRQNQTTAVVDDCLDPRWDSETWTFDVPAETTLVRFEVWDKDALQDDPLGHVSFPARLAPATPGEERIRFALDSVQHGELEVEMAFLRCPAKTGA